MFFQSAYLHTAFSQSPTQRYQKTLKKLAQPKGVSYIYKSSARRGTCTTSIHEKLANNENNKDPLLGIYHPDDRPHAVFSHRQLHEQPQKRRVRSTPRLPAIHL